MNLILGNDEIFVKYDASDAVDFTDWKRNGFYCRIGFLRDARGSLCFSRRFRLFMTIQGSE